MDVLCALAESERETGGLSEDWFGVNKRYS